MAARVSTGGAPPRVDSGLVHVTLVRATSVNLTERDLKSSYSLGLALLEHATLWIKPEWTQDERPRADNDPVTPLRGTPVRPLGTTLLVKLSYDDGYVNESACPAQRGPA